ncbi:hypothetical protein MPSEU_000690600 [Mayamaea pseudoterrestris]|nr:hypothetical protein MPSEU_000690600 [Mayamaea pseudoterrestris]
MTLSVVAATESGGKMVVPKLKKDSDLMAAAGPSLRRIKYCCLLRARVTQQQRLTSALVDDEHEKGRRLRRPRNRSPAGSNEIFDYNSKQQERASTRRSPRSLSFSRPSAPNASLPRVDQATMTDSVAPKSLFETFNIPDPTMTPTASTSCSAYESSQSFRSYLDILEPILNGESMSNRVKSLQETTKGLEFLKPIFAWLKSPDLELDYHLPSLKAVLRGLHISSSSTMNAGSQQQQQPPPQQQLVKKAFRQELLDQRQRFRDTHHLNQKQFELTEAILVTIASQCTKQANVEPVAVVWRKLKQAGVAHQGMLHALLHLTSLSQRYQPYHNGMSSILDVLDASPRKQDLTSNAEATKVDLVDEIAAYHDLLFKPTEQTVNVQVRLLVAQERFHEAEQLLATHADKMELRLRSFLPIFQSYLQQKDMDSVLRLYHFMQSLSTVHFDCDTYVSLLVGMAEHGCFAPGALAIESTKTLGFSVARGPQLFDELAAQMAMDVTEIPAGSAKRLYNALATGMPQYHLQPITSFAPLPIVSEPAIAEELVVNRVRIDPSSGQCLRTGVKLRLIRLEEDESSRLKEGIMRLARTTQVKFQENWKEGKTQMKARADEDLENFFQLLDKREGDPFTCIVDGANVGYYLQNFDDGRFSYYQIKFVVDHLESLGENPLVIIPFKYTQSYFYVTIGAGGSLGSRKQILTKDEKAIRDELVRARKVFVVPRGFLDDFYWILASLSKQSKARNGSDLFVQPDNADGRWPGGRPVLISNDQMRDHKIGMLEPRLFRRWYSNFIVNYNFAGFVNDACTSEEIDFTPADFYSREIQANAAAGATVWHMPISETEDEWLCIRIPLTQTQ